MNDKIKRILIIIGWTTFAYSVLVWNPLAETWFKYLWFYVTGGVLTIIMNRLN